MNLHQLPQRQRIIAGSVLGIILIVFGINYFRENRVVARVGDYKILNKDRKYRDQVARVFYPKDPEDRGLEQLVKAFTYAQILKNNGIEITEHTVRTEEMRINQNTKDPATLRKIRAIFDGDDEAYKKDFILPTYAERTIYTDFFNTNPIAQSRSLNNVSVFLKEVKEGHRDMVLLAMDKKYRHSQFTVTPEGVEWMKGPDPMEERMKNPQDKKDPRTGKNGLEDMTQKPPMVVQREMDRQFKERTKETAQNWLDNILPSLKVGEVIPEPVDNNDTWLIVKLLKKVNKNKYILQAVFIPKDNYEEWLIKETAKIKIKK